MLPSFRSVCPAFYAALLAMLTAAPLLAVDQPASTFQPQTPAGYTSRIDGTGQEEVYDSYSDASGNLYVVGRFSSPQASVDVIKSSSPTNAGFNRTATTTVAGGSGGPIYYLFVTKYDVNGNVLWTRSAGGTSGAYNNTGTVATGVVADANGNVFITGSISGQTAFGTITADVNQGVTAYQSPGNYTSVGRDGDNIFVAMLSKDGLWQWVKPMAATYFETDTSNALSGTLSSTFPYFRNGSPHNDSSSTPLIRPQGPIDGHAIALGPDGSLYIRGELESGNNATGTLSTKRSHVLWMRLSGSETNTANRVALAWVSSSGLVTTYENSAFIAKLAATPPPAGSAAGTSSTYAWSWVTPVVTGAPQINGTITPATTWDTTNASAIGSLAADASSVYLTGTFRATNNALSGGAGTPPRSDTDGFVARLNASSGAPVYLATYSGANSAHAAMLDCASQPGALVVDDQSNVYITGHLRAKVVGSNVASLLTVDGTGGAVNYKDGFAVSYGGQLPFLAKLDPTGRWLWMAPPVNADGGNLANAVPYGWATSLSRDAAGGLYMGGCIANGFSSNGQSGRAATLTFNNPSPLPPAGSPISGVASAYVVNGPLLNSGGALSLYTCAYLVKMTEVDATTRYWRWALQSTNSNGASAVGYDTAVVSAGINGTVYWSLNDLLPGNPSDFAGSNRSGGFGNDIYDVPTQTGSFVLPILMDAPSLSPAFSVTNNVACGAAIVPPQGITYDSNNRPLQPNIVNPANGADARSTFYWDAYAGVLYPISPAFAEIRWHTTADANDTTHYLPVRVNANWSSSYENREVTGAGTNGDEPRVDVQPAGIAYTYQSLLYQDNGTTVTGRTLACTNHGTGNHAVLLYTTGANSTLGNASAVVRVVRSYDYNDASVASPAQTATVGTEITPATSGHSDPSGKNAYIVNAATGPYDGYGTGAAYNATTRTGWIIPVNSGRLQLITSQLSPEGVAFPGSVPTFNCQFPQSTQIGVSKQIVVTSQLGSEVYGQTRLDPATYTSLQVYHQPDRTLPGFNPNEEHALLAPTNLSGAPAATASWPAVFALRNDLNTINNVTTSQPWVLLRYKDAADSLKTKFFVYYVTLVQNTQNLNNVFYTNYNFGTFFGVAGNAITAPYPLSILGNSPNTTGSGMPYFKDRNNQVWARAAGSAINSLIANYSYPNQPGFWYDPTGSGTASTATQIPWLDKFYAANYSQAIYGYPVVATAPAAGTPIPVSYSVYWPDDTAVLSIPSIAGQYQATVPTLHTGDTLTRPAVTEQAGLFDVENAGALSIIYDTNDMGVFSSVTNTIVNLNPANDSVRLYDYATERRVLLDARINGQFLVINNSSGATTSIAVEPAGGGRYRFTDLPYQLKVRVLFDPTLVTDPSTNRQVGTLLVGGYKDATVAGRPILLPNILSNSDQMTLQGFYVKNGVTTSSTWNNAAAALYTLSRDPHRTGISGGYGVGLDVVSSGTGGATTVVRAAAQGLKAIATPVFPTVNNTYVLLAENNAASSGVLPVAMHLFKVSSVPVIGEIKVIQSNNPLEERITLRHSSDFAGNASAWRFDWYYKADPGSPVSTPSSTGGPGGPVNPSSSPPDGGWTSLASGVGMNEVVIQGNGTKMLQDSYVICRYSPLFGATSYTYWAGSPGNTVVYPGGTIPASANYFAAFSPGWIKRVIGGLNPFETRVKDFGSAPTATYSSMIQQAGKSYLGPVALNNDPGNLNNVGLIELYQTVLERGLSLSVNNGSDASATNGSVNNELLLAATRVSDFYMLLGNEAYADAQDPTVGITSQDGTYKSLAPTLFSFQNMVPSLLQEELSLLRGRDNTGTTTGAFPVYNRLYWNFSGGLEGEPVYVQNYNINDQNQDGLINASDAAILYPQGHGDAWGHYLSAVKEHYRLLRHPNYKWTPRAETALIQGVGVEVDYFDEKKFAAAAAARANAGAEIVNLTYRDSYVANPDGQWQGYQDGDPTRFWGVDDWARRAGQGAFLDWVTATAILPANQTTLLPPNNAQNATGLSKIDRTTVGDLANVANAYSKVQGQMDQADQGLNPLGLSPGAIPFDIDPSFSQSGSNAGANTHFEQVMGRATAATSSARQVFDYANDLTNRLRQTQLSADKFAQESQQQEFDYKNQLIAIFGYPYLGDIGPGSTYPTSYDGPDLYHYNYVPVNDVSGGSAIADTTFTGFFRSMGMEFTAQAGSSGGTTTGSFSQVVGHFFPNDGVESAASAAAALQVSFPFATAADWSFVAPASWGSRRAPGALQMAINDIVTAEANLRRGAVNYRNQVADIQDLVDLLQARSNIQANEISITDTANTAIKTLGAEIVHVQGVILGLDVGAQAARDITDGSAASIPTEFVSNPVLTAVRGGVIAAGYAVADILASVSASQQSRVNQDTADQTTTANEAQLSIQKDEFAYEVQQQLKAIESQLRQLVGLRVDLFTLQQALSQSIGNYQQLLAQGQQLLEAREMYRRNVAGAVQLNRYQDMSFRIFRNDALQKYRAAFDLAAKYTYLAATAYDYETCLLDTKTTAGARFLTDIVGERALGQYADNGTPQVGAAGLSDPLARLSQNFAVLKGQLGINNPQFESGRFSLRNELYRILPGQDETWRDQLQTLRVDNLWSVPEFRRYCKPFAPESAGAQPGLVIPFNTDITFGYNFFHQELAGGDSSYDSSRYVTKISSVGVWFSNYNGQGLSTTPRVYLVPTGSDMMRTPNGPNLTTRSFDVEDQAIPTPFPVGSSDFANPEWIPQNNGLSGPLSDIRQFSRFRAYHDAGFDQNQVVGDTRLIGRSVWNTQWLLIIPGGTFLNNATTGLDTFIGGQPVAGSTTGARDGNGVSDIKLIFQTYSYSGD